jgi:Tfp pilus assembly PilM family ATPase
MFTNGTLIGLDIGHHTVRAVALRRSGNRYQMVGHAAVHRRDQDGAMRGMAVSLGELDSVMRLKGRACIAIGDLSALVRYVATIPLPPERLARLLRLELQQHLEGAELSADTFPVPLAGDEIIHCCVLVQPTQVYDALKELKSARISPGRIHFAPMAVYNSTVIDPPVSEEEIALLVDIGAQSTGVALFGERRLLACRQLAIGGDTFTEALTTPGRTASQAEAFKCTGQAPPATPSASTLPAPPADALPHATEAVPPPPAPGAQARSATSTSINTTAMANISSTSLLMLDDQEPLVLSEEVIAPHPKLLELEDDAVKELTLDAPWLDQAAEAPATSAAAAPFPPPGSHPSLEEPVVPATPPGSDDFNQLLNDGVPAPGMATMAHAREALGPELTKVAESLYAQLASSVAWFKTQIHARNLAVTKVFLVGGGAGLSGLDGYLERRFGVPVRIYDPCAVIDGQGPDRPHEWATAIGLALSSARGAVSLDLTPDQLLRRQAWTQRLVWPFVAAACLLITGLFTGWTLLNQQSVDRESLETFAAYQHGYDALKSQLDDLQAEKEGLSDDLRSIASRLYAGRDLLYTVRALKERTKQSPELWITRLETNEVSQDAAVRDPASATHRVSSSTPPPKGGRKDSAIDRGAVDISGLVKFNTEHSDTELNRFFEDYMQWIAAWKPSPNEPPLFRPNSVKVLTHIINHDHDKDNKAKIVVGDEAGRFPFQLRYFFQPTDLAQITSEHEALALPVKTPPVKKVPHGP